MPPMICQCMWRLPYCTAKTLALKGGTLPYLSSASITKMLHVNRACPWFPLCFGDVYGTHAQPCHCGFVSVHSKLLSCPAVIPHPPQGHDLTELTACGFDTNGLAALPDLMGFIFCCHLMLCLLSRRYG